MGRKGGPHSVSLGKQCGTWRYWLRTAAGDLLAPLIAGVEPHAKAEASFGWDLIHLIHPHQPQAG